MNSSLFENFQAPWITISHLYHLYLRKDKNFDLRQVFSSYSTNLKLLISSFYGFSASLTKNKVKGKVSKQTRSKI